MVEADIYINTYYENHYGGVLYDTTKIIDLDELHAAFALVDHTYVTIVHELGHALGLKHVPVSGNIMSYNYLPRMVETWKTPLNTAAAITAGQSTPEQLGWDEFPFAQRREDISPYMYTDSSATRTIELIDLYRDSISLGEQDRMALMCIYDFADWNH